MGCPMAWLRKEMTCFGYSLALSRSAVFPAAAVLLLFSARTSPSRPGQDPQQCPRPSRADGHPHRSPSSCPASYQVKIACPFSDGEPEGLPHRHPLVAMRRRAMDHVELRNTGARVHSASFPHRVSDLDARVCSRMVTRSRSCTFLSALFTWHEPHLNTQCHISQH